MASTAEAGCSRAKPDAREVARYAGGVDRVVGHLLVVDDDGAAQEQGNDRQVVCQYVLGLIDELQSVDTTGIAPMSHALDLVQRLRPDEVTEPDRREAYQKVAPAVEEGLYLVPKVIE